MATTQFAFVSVGEDAHDIPYVANASCEDKTPSGTSSATTAVAGASQKFCRVATDTQVYVSFGSSPNAGSDTIRFLCPANSVNWFRVSAGDKAAVKT